jgi:hypothetical protein
MRKNGAENRINGQLCLATGASDVKVLAVLLSHGRILRLFAGDMHGQPIRIKKNGECKKRGHPPRPVPCVFGYPRKSAKPWPDFRRA